ncbi:signal peptidase I [Paenibacillus sp. B01]|uniref:signal peptidase I n=1 Tax=Paenibacillus sp. B01 TaxID=2660554 RepID=UPI00129B4138|nr:signal peptidase I [Paenibacillus sp. B01]QGG57432.1 signal peptidase I [Paenibacillus sp. B01]
MIRKLLLVASAALLLGGCEEPISDVSTPRMIPALEETSGDWIRTKVHTDGMLADLGYGTDHPFRVNQEVFVAPYQDGKNDIRRGDIVLFAVSNPDSQQKTDIARVVGLPGETIEIRKGTVSIDGTRLDAFYGSDSSISNGDSWSPVSLGVDDYYLLADIRWRGFHDSQTSGGFSSQDILGRVVGYPKK